MMMNMMNGAVAVNGDVGVMEMRRPHDFFPNMGDVAKTTTEAVALIVENAHITLRELKNKISVVTEKKLPEYKQLMEQNPIAVAQTSVNDATLTVYQNGYAVYEEAGVHSVMAVDRCGDYRYDFSDGTYQIVPAEVFEEAEWSLRLIMEGERRLENNRNKISRSYEECTLSYGGSDWCEAAMVDFMADENEEMLADEEIRRLYAAMNKLTERQSEIIQLCFYKGMTQQEIADEMGIARPVVAKIIKDALKKLKKVF